MEKLGENVRNRRKQLGLTQDQVADLTGYTSRSSVAKIEKGQVDLTQTKIIALAKALQCEPGDLLDGVEIIEQDPFIGLKVVLEQTYVKYHAPFQDLPAELQNQLLAAAISAAQTYYHNLDKK